MKTSRKLWRLRLALGAAAVGLGVSPAMAQTTATRGGEGRGQGTRAAAPAPAAPFGGVRSQAPRGLRTGDGGLGGVRAQAPRPLSRTGTLLPPPPTRAPFVSAPVRGRTGGVVRRPERDVGFGQPVGWGRGYVEESGTWFWGGYGGPSDRLRVRFRSGGPEYYWSPQHGARHRHHPRPYYPPVFYPRGGTFLYTGPYGYESYSGTWPVYTVGSGYVDPLVYGQPAPPQYTPPPPAPPAPPVELTTTDRAALQMMSGRADDAVRTLRSHLQQEADDAEAMRLLAAALLQTRQLPEAVAVMALAYDTEPALADRPLDVLLFGGDEGARRALNRAVMHANSVNTASSWLLVTSIMQAEGRDAVASRMLARAVDRGLEERVAGQFTAALTR